MKKAFDSIHRLGIDGEVIVADNGSSDSSVSIAQSLGAKVISIQKKGYGSALRGGIEAASYQYIVMGDADDSYFFSALDAFIARENRQLRLAVFPSNKFLPLKDRESPVKQ